jgi:hypothetical protein
MDREALIVKNVQLRQSNPEDVLTAEHDAAICFGRCASRFTSGLIEDRYVPWLMVAFIFISSEVH